MAFPVVAGSSASSQGTNNGTSTVTLPASIAAGDLLLAFIAADVGAGAMTWPAGWVEIKDETVSTTAWASVAYKIAAGGDSNPAVTHASERSNHLALRITGWHGTTAPEITANATSASTAPNPPSLSPSWGAEDTMWIAFCAWDDNVASTVSVYPTNYGSNNLTVTTATSAGRLAVATRELNAASEDPGAFTLTASEQWNAYTVAVRPAGSGPQTVTLDFLDAASALYAPTLVGKNLITLGLIDASPALYAPTLVGYNVITLGLLDAGPALYAPSIIATQIISLGLLDAAPALYAPTISTLNLISLGLIDAGPALYAPSLATLNLISLGLIDAGAALYAPTISTLNLISLGLIDAGPALYAPTIGQFSQVTLPLLDAGGALYAPTLTTLSFLVVPFLDAGAALYAPTLTGVNLVSLPLLDGGSALYAPVLAASGLLILVPFLESMAELYAPEILNLGVDPAELLALGILRQEFWPRTRRVNRDHYTL